jgi:hypothetical protein
MRRRAEGHQVVIGYDVTISPRRRPILKRCFLSFKAYRTSMAKVSACCSQWEVYEKQENS